MHTLDSTSGTAVVDTMASSSPLGAPTTQRFHGLDSLRGLASLSVMLCHCLHMVQFSTFSLAYAPLITLLYAPMMKVFINANDAVLLFFMHSGYVLALPFIARRNSSYPAFTLKRIFRIYPAHMVVMCLLMLGIVFWHPQPIPAMGDWFNRKATVQPSLHDLAQQNALLFMDPGNDPQPFNGVVWSLVHEMRISLIFPLLTLVLVRRNPWLQFALLLLYPVIFHFFAPHGALFDHILPGTVMTMGYLYLFFIGIFLAEHREAISRVWSRIPAGWQVFVLLLAVLGYSSHQFLFPHSHTFLSDPILVLSLSLLVIAAANGMRVFLSRPVRWLGKVSYSLYLVHVPLLLLVTRLCYARLPFWGIWLLTIALSLAVSALLYSFVEFPLQQYGRRLAARIDARRFAAFQEGTA